jgi:alkyl hydroperoxide reductase subunit D
MNIDAIKNLLPDYAKDIRLNLSSLFQSNTGDNLNEQQTLLVALSCAYGTKCQPLISAFETLAQAHLSATEQTAAKLSATLMAMNNIYYRYTHSIENTAIKALPAKLRMNGVAQPGIQQENFELCCLAVSALNGCALCMSAHSQTLEKQGLTATAIQTSIRLSAVIHACAQALSIEQSSPQ